MTTPKLQMPELVVGQAGKELTHNQALAVLDQLAQAVVVDKDFTAPPGSPTNGSMYIVSASATGAWAGQDGKLAYWLTTVAAWTFITPTDGWSVWVTDESVRYERKSGSWIAAPTRELLTAPRAYYVRTDGSDSNTGLSNASGSAFLTIQKAVDTVASIDTGIHNVTIKIADGAYNNNVVLKPIAGAGECIIEGNTTTPANVTITPPTLGPDSSIFSSGGGLGGATYRVRGLKTSSAMSSNHFRIRGGSLYWSSLETGAGAICFFADAGAYMSAEGDWTISGNQSAHLRTTYGSVIFTQSRTVTLVGSVTFLSTGAFGFASASRASTIVAGSLTFIGSATGRRYFVEANAVIDSQGGGASYLPGDVAGVAQTGGQYL